MPVRFLTSLASSKGCVFNKALNLRLDIYIKKGTHLLLFDKFPVSYMLC